VAGAIGATLVAQTVRLVSFLWLSQRRVRLDYPLGRLALLAAALAGGALLPPLLSLAALALGVALAALLLARRPQHG
jgi:hypothetical protein